MFASSSTSGLPAVSMELSRDLITRMHDSAVCAGQSSLVVGYSAPTASGATTPFYSYAGKSSPAAGTSCSSGDDESESCGSGGSLRVTSAPTDYTEALRCRYDDEMLTGTSAAAAASSDRQQAALALGRRSDMGDGDVDVDVSADYVDDDDDDRRHSSSTPSTHRKHKGQKQVVLLLLRRLDVSLYHLRRFATWLLRYLDVSLPGRFAPLDVSIPGRFATSLNVSPPDDKD